MQKLKLNDFWMLFWTHSGDEIYANMYSAPDKEDGTVDLIGTVYVCSSWSTDGDLEFSLDGAFNEIFELGYGIPVSVFKALESKFFELFPRSKP